MRLNSYDMRLHYTHVPTSLFRLCLLIVVLSHGIQTFTTSNRGSILH